MEAKGANPKIPPAKDELARSYLHYTIYKRQVAPHRIILLYNCRRYIPRVRAKTDKRVIIISSRLGSYQCASDNSPYALLPCTVPLFRLEMMVLNPLPPAIPPVPTLYIELAGRFPGGAVVDAAPLIVPLLLHEYT